MIEKLLKEKVVAVLRAKNHEDAMKQVDACIEGGMNAVELTYSIPDVCSLIESVIVKYPNALVGVGSVLTTKQAIDAIESGAMYVVSPGFSEEVQIVCDEKNVIYMPGAMTISEIMNSMSRGNEITKLFPGNLYSPKYIKAIKAPIPHAELMVTGGVDINNIEEWFAAGVTMVGVGSSLTGAIEGDDYSKMAKLAKAFKDKVA